MFIVSLLLFAGGSRVEAEIWTLPQALNFARTNAPDARMAQARLDASRAMLQQANALFWPGVQLQSSYIRTDNPMNVFGAVLNQHAWSPDLDFNHVPDADNLNVRGIISAPLYAGGRNTASRKAAKAGVKSAEAAAEAVGSELQAEVARSFFTVLRQRRFIEAAEAAVRAFETNRVIAGRRFDAGTLLKTELLDLDVRLSQAREDLLRSRNASVLAVAALQTVLGIGSGPFDVAGMPPEMSVPRNLDFSLRPELRALEMRLDAAEAQVRKAQGGYLPEVRAFVEVDHDSGWEFNGSGHSYAGGIVAKWDLWDGNLTRGRVSEARANLEQLREEYRKTKLGMELEVRQAQLRLDEAGERLVVTGETVRNAEESARLTRARFEQGMALSTQLMDSETALTAARVRQAEAESDRRIAIVALRKAVGLPQLEEGQQ